MKTGVYQIRNTVKGIKNHAAKLNESDVVEIKRLLENHIKQKVIAEQFGITFQTVSKIKLGLIWTHVQGR